jgi:uncharacterized 2Fe-2S/4Fe-4S cluster protein (DUF4445 family)
VAGGPYAHFSDSMKHFTITFEPDDRQISVHAGATVAEAAAKAGIILNGACGGRGLCGKCEVMLADGTKVLACQKRVDGDLSVTVPAALRFYERKVLAGGPGFDGPAAGIKRGDGAAGLFGLAVDVGTTTVAARLIELAGGRCVAAKAFANPQAGYGADVISRIGHCRTHEGLLRLKRLVLDCVNELAEACCRQAGIAAGDVVEVCVVGNTAMNHILRGLPVEQMGRAPFSAHRLEAEDIPAAELDIAVNPAANVHVAANITGFVGADITAAALAVEMDRAADHTMLLDIGTNGEIVLAAGGKLYAASCAAGPALEGAGISCGSAAVEGAIESVVLNGGDLEPDVIGRGPCRSICGSGLIDAAAVLLETGLLGRDGRLGGGGGVPEGLGDSMTRRLIERDGQPAFVLAGGGSAGAEVVLTQGDIRRLQLAKAAIRAGIMLLHRKTGNREEDLDRVMLAGAFGNYIRIESAFRIGLLPDMEAEKVRFVGNAACFGAQMMLVGRDWRRRAKRLARGIEYVSIAEEDDFAEVFAKCMGF